MNRVGHERNSLPVFFVHPIHGTFADQTKKPMVKIAYRKKSLLF
jgi:hypothetical protein